MKPLRVLFPPLSALFLATAESPVPATSKRLPNRVHIPGVVGGFDRVAAARALEQALLGSHSVSPDIIGPAAAKTIQERICLALAT